MEDKITIELETCFRDRSITLMKVNGEWLAHMLLNDDKFLGIRGLNRDMVLLEVGYQVGMYPDILRLG